MDCVFLETKIKSMLLWVIVFALLQGCWNDRPISSNGDLPSFVLNESDLIDAPPEELARIGRILTFGTEYPELIEDGVIMGRGQCPLCHRFFAWQKVDRGPDLIGMEALSHQRVKEERYRLFIKEYQSEAEPYSGLRPHAKTGGEFMIEHSYCPSCYVPVGFGLSGTNDMISPTFIFNKPPISLTDVEIVSVVAYLQSKDTPGDYSKVTAKRDWENYFGRTLSPSTKEIDPSLSGRAFQVDWRNGHDPTTVIMLMACFACHQIPTIGESDIGRKGPLLVQKDDAPKRIQSMEYKRAVDEGRAHAKTPREYVKESIVNPEAFVVPGFSDQMPKVYRHRLSGVALENVVDFLLTLDTEMARMDGLDRLPQEKEGSLYN